MNGSKLKKYFPLLINCQFLPLQHSERTTLRKRRHLKTSVHILYFFSTSFCCCRFSTLVSAMSAAGLSRSLAGKRPLTLFAPTNEAFADLNGLADLLNNRNDIRAVSPWRNKDEESKANGSLGFFS